MSISSFLKIGKITGWPTDVITFGFINVFIGLSRKKKYTSKAPFPRQNYQLELKIYDKHTPTYLCMSIILLGFNELKIIYKYDIAFIYLIFWNRVYKIQIHPGFNKSTTTIFMLTSTKAG